MKKVLSKISEEYKFQKVFYLLSLVTWTVLGIFMSIQLYSGYLKSNRSANVLDILAVEFTFSYLWLLLSPAILKLSFRLSFDKTSWFFSSIVHLLAALTGSTITLFGRRVVQWITIDNTSIELTGERLFNSVFYSLDYGIMSYLLVAFFSYTYKYYKQFKERELTTAKLEAELLKAQLLALKVQIQPHFLFNTLNSITALIRKKENDKAIEMVSGLGKFLRYTLEKNDSQFVPFSEEIELLKTYLEIQQIRFGDRLKMDICIEPETNNTVIPNLILQPIVENCIKHGVSDKISDAEINISAKRNNGYLQIIVCDNGPGFTNPDNLQILPGLGLKNVQARLEKLYKSEGNLKISNLESGGAKVELIIPMSN